MQKKKHFITLNEGFTCNNCGITIPAANKTCRNHCTTCLYSLHIDDILPGDRASKCLGLMQPISLGIDKKKGYIITHECNACGKIQNNKTAEDDDFDKLTELLTKTNLKNTVR
ncbi:MAG: RNHCP domain-containing protein [Candidatus Peregrinibacteria bacterium]|nr:RNHCP domain-containing protein [Candidatus Peregrinibacteria bacterium]MDZ4244553.1 RNHCP domain-containing protein [Candidatus Gracilibacteria bacterium]